MPGLSSSELAGALQLSKGRISQYVAEGKLDGCYQGDGRARRFDLDKVAVALGKRLDPGQMMGNGAATRQALKTIAPAKRAMAPLPYLPEVAPEDDDEDALPPRNPAGATVLPKGDPDRYEMARTQKAEEEARRLRRINAEAEGLYVLADEVARQVAQAIGQEVREFEGVLRDGARRVADELGVDYLKVRQLLTDQWRGHRGKRLVVLQGQADAAEMAPAERAADI